MSVILTEDQVLDIHLNSRVNGGRVHMHTMCKRHGITVNECYSVLAYALNDALRRGAKGFRFMSWDPQKERIKPTKEEMADSKQTKVLLKNMLPPR